MIKAKINCAAPILAGTSISISDTISDTDTSLIHIPGVTENIAIKTIYFQFCYVLDTFLNLLDTAQPSQGLTYPLPLLNDQSPLTLTLRRPELPIPPAAVLLPQVVAPWQHHQPQQPESSSSSPLPSSPTDPQSPKAAPIFPSPLMAAPYLQIPNSKLGPCVVVYPIRCLVIYPPTSGLHCEIMLPF